MTVKKKGKSTALHKQTKNFVVARVHKRISYVLLVVVIKKN